MRHLLFAPPRLSVTFQSAEWQFVFPVTELLSLCDALEAKLTQAESASTQLLSAAVHSLLNEASREGAKPRSREAAKGTTMSFQFFAPPRLRVTTELLSLCASSRKKSRNPIRVTR